MPREQYRVSSDRDLRSAVRELNDILGRVSDELARVQGLDGHTPTFLTGPSMSGTRISSVGMPLHQDDVVTLRYLRQHSVVGAGGFLEAREPIIARAGVRSGIPAVDALDLVTLGQLETHVVTVVGGSTATSAPPAVGNASVLGAVTTRFAREDHTHATGGTAGGDLSGTYPNPSVTHDSHTHAIGSTVTGLGTGVATWLGTPSSANLASAVTGETGAGALVFGTDPTFTTKLTTPEIRGVSSALVLDSDGSGGGVVDCEDMLRLSPSLATVATTTARSLLQFTNAVTLAAAGGFDTTTLRGLQFSPTATLGTNTVVAAVDAAGSYTYTSGAGFGSWFLFWAHPAIASNTASVATPNLIVHAVAPALSANANIGTVGNVYCYIETPTTSVGASGTMTVAALYGRYSWPQITQTAGGALTVTDIVRLHCANPGVTGTPTIAADTAMYVADLTRATSNRSLRSVGTSVVMRHAGPATIGSDADPNANAICEFISTTKGVLLPRGTADPTGVAGMLFFRTDTSKLRLYDGTSWVDLN